MDPNQASEMTVGQFLDLLADHDRNATLRLAINPFFPMAHRLGGIAATRDENGHPMVFIAEAGDAAQLGYLPPDIAVQLTWQSPTEPPRPKQRRTTRRNSSD